MASLREDIAKAIRQADSSYFFEDYTKQAQAVLRLLDSKGLMLVPKEPTEPMMTSGVEAIPSGRVKPESVAAEIYKAMVKHGAKSVLENKTVEIANDKKKSA